MTELLRRHLLSSLVLLTPLLLLFRRALFFGEIFIFRDAAHYYYPLYDYVQRRWMQGLPLWNPLDGLGQPLLGDPTAAVAYPGKLLFCLPVEYSTCFALYTVLHLWLGGVGAYFLARSWRVSFLGALLSGLTFELSGQVLFQYCNTIFCVGAGWLPWAVLFLERMLRRKQQRDIVFLGIVLSLMTLGGDPQQAYHTVIVGILLATCLATTAKQSTVDFAKVLAAHGVRLMAACLVGLLLSAAQVVPAVEWSSISDRAMRDAPRSLPEWVHDITARRVKGQRVAISGLWRRDKDNEHFGKVYEFSVGPWRWMEVAWPNLGGQQFPIHRRWMNAIPAEGRVWTPSLYLGLLPCLLGVIRFRLCRGSPRVRWLSCCVVFSIVAALGEYGGGWLFDEFRFHLDQNQFQHSEVLPGIGGLYWLMTVLLPSYLSFRYPAKWWTIAVLAWSLLAGKCWSSHVEGRAQSYFARKLGQFALVSSALAVVSWLAFSGFAQTLRISPDVLFGTFDANLARYDVTRAFLHATAVSALASAIIRVWLKRNSASRPVDSVNMQAVHRNASAILLRMRGIAPAAPMIFILVVLEIIIAQSWMVQTAPWPKTNSEAITSGDCVYRTEAILGYPDSWRTSRSRQRLVDCQRNDLTTLLPKYHLLHDTRSLVSTVPIASADYQAFHEVAREQGPTTVEGQQLPALDMLHLLRADRLVVRPVDYPTLSATVEPGQPLAIVTDSRTRAWIVHDWISLRPRSEVTRASLLDRTRAMFRGDVSIDFSTQAFVETETPPILRSATSAVDDSCRVVRSEAECVELWATVSTPALLVLADQYFPGWKVFVRTNGEGQFVRQEVVRTNRVMRGVFLDPGKHVIQFRYEPGSVTLGLWISLLAWTFTLIGCTGRIPIGSKSES